ncbi:hypothetical protein [Streptomyces sp. I05A-00742]|uniref:hypothetical protein n=1 Tax=Streptomyces sp. I05A-00742 TaxID=2732853 RepID=UPI0014895F22|nr:hypothetical protein [Streptomyces sp. I05A-00742]
MTGESKWRGWRNREIPLDMEPGVPALLGLKSGLTSSFYASGIRRTESEEEHGPTILGTHGNEEHRFMLNPKYTHVHLVRHVGREGSTGVAGWRLRRLPLTSARPLSGVVTGDVHDVLMCDPATRNITYSFDGNPYDSRIMYISPDGKRTRELPRIGHLRGNLRIPGTGYLQIHSPKSWKITA